ncbi:hypothetical protein EYB33_15185 [Lysinibacillus sphaericus]|uniref:hypothetical protein n=1 Tax=Lysinibacillus sphaericus TaxID=1421 RepID=UPI001E40D1B1|nr:hypothetical protein [Lysinibacillus sphaericus]UDK97568.1 hypothetical protein EYB33_15185 [Lysinibacillus sphaericus]
MKKIDYSNKKERKINGQYYVKKFIDRENEEYKIVLFNAEGELVKPVFDYTNRLINEKNSNYAVYKTVKSISHYYDFCKLYEISDNTIIDHELLNNLILFLSAIPKGTSKLTFLDHLSNREYIMVHPYIKGKSNKECISNIYLEWYKLLGNDNVISFTSPSEMNIRVEDDERDWRYSYEDICRIVRDILNYLEWLSKDFLWEKFYIAINKEIVRKITFLNGYKEIRIWDIGKRVSKITGLKSNVELASMKRVFTEGEIKNIFENHIIQNTKYKLMFHILLFTGLRISELLNLLIAEKSIVEEVKIGRKVIYTIKWEHLLCLNPHLFPVNQDYLDIVIDLNFNFHIRVKKRSEYETSRRKNKSKKTRFIRLRDVYNYSELFDSGEMFISMEEVIKIFKNEILINTKSKNIKEILEHILSKKEKSNIVWLEMFRDAIESSLFGRLLKEYLIHRFKVLKKGKFADERGKDHLFINDKEYLNFIKPWEPYVIDNLFTKVLLEEKINPHTRNRNVFTKHNVKKSLSLHSFRHTYITYRIGFENINGNFSASSLANLKKEVGHIKESDITLKVYYFLDVEREERGRSAIYNFIKNKLSQQKETED